MSADVTAWLSGATRSRWWKLSDRHLRVAMTLVAMAKERDGVLVADVTSCEVAEACAMSRRSLGRAMDALIAAGFCVIETSEGRGGSTVITIVDSAQFGHSTTAQCNNHESHGLSVVAEDQRAVNGSLTRPVSSSPATGSQVIESVCVSLADHGDRDRNSGDPPGDLPSFDARSLGQNAATPRARDLDLLRSSDPDLRSDLRSSDLEILITKVVDPEPPQETTPRAARPKAKNMRTDPAKVPERAWAAADYMRAQIIAEDGASFIAAAAWKPGWVWTAGAGDRKGDGGRSGLRLSWANSFRLLHAWLLKAMRNVNPAATEEAAWEEIAKAVYWLFHKQPVSGPRFVVQSPDSLRDKWDRIKRCRENSANSSQRGANGRPDPIQKRRWIPADEWGER